MHRSIGMFNTHPASLLPGQNPEHSTTFHARGVGNLMRKGFPAVGNLNFALLYNPDPAVIFNKVILTKIKTPIYTIGSKYGTITIRKRALMMFLNTQSRFLLFAFKLFSEFEEFRFHFACDLTEQLD